MTPAHIPSQRECEGLNDSLLEAVERCIAQDKLLADSEEEDEYYDDEEEEEGDAAPEGASQSTAPAVPVKVVVQEINKIALDTV